MIKTHRKPKAIIGGDATAAVLRFSWAYTVTIEALHVMCTSTGAVRHRLASIDPEFLKLALEDFPEQEGVRERFGQFQTLVRQLQPRHEVLGTVASTSNPPSSAALEKMAQLLWDIHRDFSHFMQSDASPGALGTPSASALPSTRQGDAASAAK
jgi:hypothetical protein